MCVMVNASGHLQPLLCETDNFHNLGILKSKCMLTCPHLKVTTKVVLHCVNVILLVMILHGNYTLANCISAVHSIAINHIEFITLFLTLDVGWFIESVF